MAGMRSIKAVVKSSQQLHIFLQHLVWKDSEHLFRQVIFGNPEVVVQPCQSPPADMHGGKDMGLCPLHDLLQLFPVVDIGKRKVLDRSTCDNTAVIIFVLDFCKRMIKGVQMHFVGVLADVAGNL